jgi:hypothetical protein
MHLLKGIVQRKLTGVKKSSNDRYSFRDGELGILLIFKGRHLGFCQEPFAAS